MLAGLVVAGWRLFLFLCDDDFIVFRYASNHARGWGFTWNPPPFRPVDGFTNFLWLVLVRVAWGVSGVEPPASAPWIALACGLLTLCLGWRLVRQMALPAALEPHRFWLACLALFGTATNRTFLTWISPGIGSALFNLCLTWWLAALLAPAARRGEGRRVELALSASLLALTRPDGALFWAGTLFLCALDVLRLPSGARARAALACLPLALEPAYLAWHVATYGELLPNTFYAKHVAPWPASGLRYAASFAVEYGVWVWLLFALGWLARCVQRGPRAILATLRADLCAWAAVLLLLAHLGYYTLFIGGDHFEFRVYSHLVLFLFVSAVWLLARLAHRPVAVYAGLVAFLAASWPIAWIHWAGTRRVNAWPAAESLVFPVAPEMPAPLRPLMRPYDRWQAWLVDHYVCMRHQEHMVFAKASLAGYPSRAEGAKIRWVEDGYPVLQARGIGVPSWVLPEVAIIDLLGLNDRVIARHPVSPSKQRVLAHDRAPPRGYVAAFRPNVKFDREGNVYVEPRAYPLTPEKIREIEGRDWSREAP